MRLSYLALTLAWGSWLTSAARPAHRVARSTPNPARTVPSKATFESIKADNQKFDPKRDGPYRIAEVMDLPGFGEPTTTTYAGYITVSEVVGPRHLWFIFVESERDPDSDPVVMWLNGGPGCSSMDGFIYEHGPYNFKLERGEDEYDEPEVILERNPYGFNQVANMIFLDSPASVGLSYTEDPNDVNRNDTQTAQDAENFLRLFFAYFDEFQGNDFFITGESYGGVYVPNLALAVAKGNEAGRTPQINLKGYAVGNALTDWNHDGNATPQFAYGHGLISYELFTDLNAACNGDFWNVTPGTECDKQMGKMDAQLASLDLYDVLEPCYNGAGLKKGESLSSRDAGVSRGAYQGFTVGRAWPLRAVVNPGDIVLNWYQLADQRLGDVSVPCTDDRIASAWLNDPDVRDALNARSVDEIGRWLLCTDRIRYRHLTGSMVPVHQELMKRGVRVLVYSGDHDMCIPWTGTTSWIRSMNLKSEQEQKPWFVGIERGDPQVAGYVHYYKGLTFASVKGAGHMVPQNKPEEALHMMSRFFSNQKL